MTVRLKRFVAVILAILAIGIAASIAGAEPEARPTRPTYTTSVASTATP